MRGRSLAILLTSMMMLSMLAGCLGEGGQPIDDGGIEPPEILGCTHPGALNYNADATEDDGSCEFEQEEAPVEGCTDSEATNFDPEADLDDGSCTYEEPPTFGCTDPEATNFDEKANMDDGSCEYPPDPIPGCTDANATNFDPAATEDDGSCEYPPEPLDLWALTQQAAVGEQQVLVIAVHYPGENLTEPIEQIRSAIESVGRWFSNVSYGKVWFNITMAGPYEIENIGTASNEVYAAVIEDGYDVTAYNRIILGGHSSTSSSSWSTRGLDSLNVTDNQGGTHEIIASRLQINTAFYWLGEPSKTIHHEMGHSFGLGHAGFYSTMTGQLYTYGTWNSIMGLPANLPFLSMSDAHQLGWVGGDNVTTVTSDGQWTLNTIEEVDAQGIRIPIPADDGSEIDEADQRYYWLTPRSQGEFSTAELTESFPPHALHPANTGGLGTIAIDTTPETQMWKGEMDTDLLPGRSWSDPTGTIHIRLLNSTNDTVTVSVRFTDAQDPANPQAPTNTAPTIDEVTATLVSTDPFLYAFNTNASDADGDELTYFWNFGAKANGKFSLSNHGDGQSQSHEFAQQNDRRVWVTVSDGAGGVTRGWVDLENHTNGAPTLSEFILSKEGGVVFESNASDPNNDPMIYTWDFGDGNFSHSKRAFHEYEVAGQYNVTLTIDDGEFSATYSEVVDSQWPGYPPNVAPIAEAGENQTGVVGDEFTLNASASYDPDSSPTPLRFTWSCVDCNATFDARSITTVIRGLGAGTWEFTIGVFDGWEWAYDSVWITVV